MADGMFGDFMGSMGHGFQSAGAILSDPVYQAQNQERENGMAQRQQLILQVMAGIQNGSIPSDQGQMVLQRLGAPNVGMGPTPQAQVAQQGLLADQELTKALGGMQDSVLASGTASDIQSKLKNVPLTALSGPKGQTLLQHVGTIAAREDATAAKREQMQFNFKIQSDRLEDRRREVETRSEDKRRSDSERAADKAEARRLQELGLKLHAQAASMGLELRRDAAAARTEVAQEKANAPVQDLINQIDVAIRMADANPEVVGGIGILSRGKEFITSTLDPTQETPASTFQQQLIGVQSAWRKLPTIAANRFKADVNKVDSAVKGLGMFTSYKQARDALVNLRGTLESGLKASGASVPKAVAKQPAGPKQGDKAKSKSNKPMTFDGKQWIYD